MDIYVGSLAFKIEEKELREAFEAYGTVDSVTVIKDHKTRQNKGYGFVKMLNEAEALKAMKALNGTELKGRNIVLSKVEPKKKARRR